METTTWARCSIPARTSSSSTSRAKPDDPSPIGAAKDIGEPNQTHLPAQTHDDWQRALRTLLEDDALRTQMGAHGRAHAEAHHTLAHAAEPLAQALFKAAADRSGAQPPGE